MSVTQTRAYEYEAQLVQTKGVPGGAFAAPDAIGHVMLRFVNDFETMGWTDMWNGPWTLMSAGHAEQLAAELFKAAGAARVIEDTGMSVSIHWAPRHDEHRER